MHMTVIAAGIQLFPDGTLFIHIALILLMIWILNRTLFRPINKVLEERENSRGGHGGAAEAILKEAGDKESKYNAEILDARSKGYDTIEKELKKATESRDKKIAEAKAEVATMLETGRSEISTMTGNARAEIAQDADKMAESIAATILK
ncbi:MAG TPA: ATP synthase F0 subunit B [Pyrinomonadaceae bacterium]|nr:ATP synthase F0 subunit B [Pyrinomonadaceae bacterium]